MGEPDAVTGPFRASLNALVDEMEKELAELREEFRKLQADVARLEGELTEAWEALRVIHAIAKAHVASEDIVQDRRSWRDVASLAALAPAKGDGDAT